MKTLIDKTFNNAKIKEINATIHKYLNSKNLDICFTNCNRYLKYQVVEKGHLFTPENIKFELRTSPSFTVDNAYNHILQLFESLMMEFGWDETLSSGKGWRLSDEKDFNN